MIKNVAAFISNGDRDGETRRECEPWSHEIRSNIVLKNGPTPASFIV